MANMGPVEYVVIGFPDNRFKGEIAPALAELVDNGLIRIIDVAFIKRPRRRRPPSRRPRPMW
jgi:hypothetical protein